MLIFRMEFIKPSGCLIALIVSCAILVFIERNFLYNRTTLDSEKNGKYYPLMGQQFQQKEEKEFQFPKDWPRWENVQENITMKDPPLIVYTRIQKCGGRSMIGLLRRLSIRNGFFVDEKDTGRNTNLKGNGVKSIANSEKPRIHHSHSRFIDFEKFGYKNPTFINIVRDPADRMASMYYFRLYGDGTPNHIRNHPEKIGNINECILSGNQKCEWTNSFWLGKYFCGMEELCSTGSGESVKLAKKHIDENYLFVGLTEDFEGTIQILERLLPDYFDGAMDIWKKIGTAFSNATATKHRGELNPEARKRLQKMLFYDYEVYNYAKAKFEEVKNRLGIE